MLVTDMGVLAMLLIVGAGVPDDSITNVEVGINKAVSAVGKSETGKAVGDKDGVGELTDVQPINQVKAIAI